MRPFPPGRSETCFKCPSRLTVPMDIKATSRSPIKDVHEYAADNTLNLHSTTMSPRSTSTWASRQEDMTTTSPPAVMKRRMLGKVNKQDAGPALHC